MKFLLTILTFLMYILLPLSVFAEEQSEFITIVNPIRISSYSIDPIKSLTNQYEIVKSNNLPASWLLTYDVISYPNLSSTMKTFDKNQDLGIFMEVTENSAKAAGINYNKTDSWHRSTSLFLSGYSQSDRIKFIDFVFNKFKDQFGFYPTSVGAWWNDSYSLDYMQRKYGVNANLVVADQFETDGYTIWGQPWGIPYYPSKNHAAIPAQTKEDKLDIVNIQWAPRDPLNGFISPTNHRASIYSSQDYFTIPLSDDYLGKLIHLYTGKSTNSFGQITLGLEGDFPPESYLPGGRYEKHLLEAKKLSDEEKITINNMQQFSRWYRQNFSLSPSHLIQNDDLLGVGITSIRYQTPMYRIGIIIDKPSKSLWIIDLRSYQNNFQEPFFLSTNKQLDLYISLPYIIDSANYPLNSLEFRNIIFKEIIDNGNAYQILFDDNKSINLEVDKISFENLGGNLPGFVLKSPYIKAEPEPNKVTLAINNKFPYDQNGFIFRELKLESINFLQQKKVIMAITLITIFIIVIASFILRISQKRLKLTVLIFLVITVCITTWYLKNSENYYVSQSEIDALLALKSLSQGKVLVLDRACLQCNFRTQNKVAALANKHSYVNKISGKSLVLDEELIESHAIGLDNFSRIKRESAKQYLKNLKVDYIYLVKHEDYYEKMPYSPGDLGIKRIFINADAEIWKVDN